MWSNPQFPADLTAFTEEILDGKLHFLSSDFCKIGSLVLNETTFHSSLYNKKKLVLIFTAWKVSKYRVFSGPYFPTFGLNMERYFSPNAGKYEPELSHRGTFRTYSNIWDRSFCEKSYQLNTVDWLFLQKISILNVWLNSGYTCPFHFAMLKKF